LNQALKILLKNKNWKELVRSVLSDKKDAGIKNSLIVIAILALSTLFNTSSAEELISKIETKIEQQVPEDSLVDKIEKIMPYPVTSTELSMLKSNNVLTGKPLFSLDFFKKTLKSKVKNTMENKILPNIKKDENLKNIDSDKIVDLVLKAFKKKLQKPEHSKALKNLQDYLKKQNQDLKLVDEVVKQTIEQTLKK
jgi:hypothetical protein